MKKLKHGIAQITDATVAYGIVASIVATLLVPMWQWGAEEYRMSVVAGQANTVQKAVNKYIADMQSTIAAGSSETSGFTLTVPMLVSAGYLPEGFSSTNYYTSTYQTLIFQPVANKFHSMTFLSGGSQLSLSEARKIANHIGVSGGYIENGVAKGALGSWQENLSSFGGFNPGDAHVVIAGFYSNGALVNDYLYRHSVAGHPELNTMGTALNMGGNDVSAAKTVSAVNVSASEGVQSGGWITATGNITAGKDVLIGGVAKLMQVNTAGTYCDTWGAISRNAIGALLSCVSGVWKSTGSTVNIGAGIIDYGSHVEEFGTVYQIPDDSCVVTNYPRPMSTVFAINVSIINNTNTSGGEISSAYATKLNSNQFQICIKNKGFTARQDVEWRAIGVS